MGQGYWTGGGLDFIKWGGTIEAEHFKGDGSQLTGISGGGGTSNLTYGDMAYWDGTNWLPMVATSYGGHWNWNSGLAAVTIQSGDIMAFKPEGQLYFSSPEGMTFSATEDSALAMQGGNVTFKPSPTDNTYSVTYTKADASTVLYQLDTTHSQNQFKSAAAPTYSQVKIFSNSGALSLLDYSADNQAIGFDCDWTSGAWYARDTSAYSISKDTDLLKIRGNVSTTSGATFSPTNIVTIDANGGNVGIGTSPSTTLHVYKSNTDYDLSVMTNAHILLDNPSSFNQSKLIFKGNGSALGGVRVDYQGNFNWHASGPQGHQFYGSLGIGTPICGFSASGVEIGYSAGATASYLLDVNGNINAVGDYYQNGTQGMTTGGSTYYVGSSSTNSIYVDTDGDGVNDTWMSIPTGFNQINIQGGIVTSIT